MSNQGRVLKADQVEKIAELLRFTDLSMIQIAERMGCSKSSIGRVNRKEGIRAYEGRRSTWAAGCAPILKR